MLTARRKWPSSSATPTTYAGYGASLIAAIVESRRDLARARRMLHARGMAISSKMLQRFYYTQVGQPFAHTRACDEDRV